MNCSPTLTKEEFKTIHNALCELRSVQERLCDVVREPITDKLHKAIRDIERGLEGAYEQDRKAFDRRSSHFEDIQAELGLKSIWSIYKVDNLADRHPYQGATKVVYEDHWGGKPVECRINGLSWAALYVASDACIRDSGDDHHVFIERFRVSETDPEVLFLSTGS